MNSEILSMKEAALLLLKEAGTPLHYRDLARQALERRLLVATGKTPAASMSAVLAVDIKTNGANSPFLRVGSGVYGLRGVHAQEETSVLEEDDKDRRVRVSHYPKYRELRLLLPIWHGQLKTHITGLRATIGKLRGTPQNQVDWTNPGQWIPERLEGTDRNLALAIWEKSGQTVNPRHVYGHWQLAYKYKLLEEDTTGVMHLTPQGQDFVETAGGKVEVFIDEQEGVFKLLSILSESAPAKFGDFIESWGEYLSRHSNYGTENTISASLRHRLRNILDRGFTTRSGTMYTLSDEGLAYLQSNGDGDTEIPATDELTELRTLARQQKESVRESLRELLLSMNPIAFEHLVKRLLEEMNYTNVEVTSPSGDGGVDVVADIELGITSVREVVQAKRHRRTIQRSVLDALRGSLHRYHAVRGTIITTSQFSSGAQQAAFEPGGAPITLIDGDKLIDLMLEYGVGARKKTIEILELDTEVFTEIESELND